jgi:hypothetical protein
VNVFIKPEHSERFQMHHWLFVEELCIPEKKKEKKIVQLKKWKKILN